MPTKRARILDEAQYRRVREYVFKYSRQPERDLLFLSLSFRGAMRAVEIAGLERRAVVNAEGYLSDTIEIFSHATKNRKYRVIPMHHEIARDLQAFFHRYQQAAYVAVSPRGGGQMTANAVTQWFFKLFRDVRYEGCSSHSGRRTALSEMARNYGRLGGSLVDVQQFAGHARLDTTQCYIETSGSLNAIVQSLGSAPPVQRSPYLGA